MDESPKDPPIYPHEYLHGPSVVDIGDLRVARGMSRRPYSSCRHKRLHYDTAERRIWCADCESTIEPFDAFEVVVNQYGRALQSLEERLKVLKEAETFQTRLLAVRQIDLAWRQRNMVPVCPTCSAGLLAEDFKYGVPGMMSKEIAEAQRRRRTGCK